MAFSDISTLRKHARVHNGERPYLCDICNRRFTQSGNLKKHRRSVHKVTDPPKVQKKTQENVGKVLENNENTPRETLVISENFSISDFSPPSFLSFLPSFLEKSMSSWQ
jgi:uncharacterized Zn-finger protein